MGLRRFGGPGMHGIGGVPLSSLGGAFHGGYFAKVLATGPIAYWPLWEASGTTARCLVNPAQNGTYNSDVSTWPPGTGIGDGNTAPQFDGANDYINANTPAFVSAFNGAEGSVAVWFRVTNVGVWTDGTQDYFVQFLVDAGNYVQCFKAGAANTMYWSYRAGAVTDSAVWAGQADTDWVHGVLTWSASADEVKGYKNGAQIDITKTILGVWAGNLATVILGAQNNTPTNVWNGWLAHIAVWNRPLSQPEVATLAVV